MKSFQGDLALKWLLLKKKLMKKSFILLLLAILVPLCACAEEYFTSNGITYLITSRSNLEVCVSGLEYSSDTTLIIPSKVNYKNRTYNVKYIGEEACSRHYFKNVYIEEGIVEIRDKAFYYCTNLHNISFPKSLTSLGDHAFMDTSIKELTLGESISYIGHRAFSECYNLERIFLNKNINYIADDAFKECRVREAFFTGTYYKNIAQENYTLGNGGISYLHFSNFHKTYDGTPLQTICSNNLKQYDCEIEMPTLETTVGKHIAYIKAKYSNDIDLTIDYPFEYEITKAPLELTINDAQREYGDANPQFTYQAKGFVADESLETLGITPAYQCEAYTLSSPGNYRILATIDAENYKVTYNYGTLTVVPAPITMTATNATKVYGDANPNFCIIYDGMKNGEKAPTWTTAPTISTTATTASPCGSYPITISGGSVTNYKVMSVKNGELLINKRDLYAKLNDYTRYYGEDNPDFKISYTGFVNNDNAESITEPSIKCTADKHSTVGNYDINISGGYADNYNILISNDNNKSTLSVLKAPISISVQDTTKVYGDANPTFNLAYTGLKNGEAEIDWVEAPTIKTDADEKSSCGTYTLTPVGGEAINYTVTSTDLGQLTITQRPLEATVENCTRLYGNTNPTYQITYSGFVNGDDKSCLSEKATATCQVTTKTDVGDYTIECKGGKATNYTISHNNGILTIKPRPINFKKEYYNYIYGTYHSPETEIQDANLIEGHIEIAYYILDPKCKAEDAVFTVTEGNFAGNYIAKPNDIPLYAGKYILTLTSNSKNFDVSTAKAYESIEAAKVVFVSKNQNNFIFNKGEKKEILKIYDLCHEPFSTITLQDPKGLLDISSDTDTIHNIIYFYATGKQVGDTELVLDILNADNGYGAYNFNNVHRSWSIQVTENTAINDITIQDGNDISVRVINHDIVTDNKPNNAIIRLYTTDGKLLADTQASVIQNVAAGLYLVHIDNKIFKVLVK